MSKTIYIVTIPAIPGPDLRHPTERSATREVRNAEKAGLTAYMRSVTLTVAA